MIQVSINRTCARLQTTEPLTSGMIGKQMQLVFDSSWTGLRKTAVFSDGKNSVSLMDSFWDGNTITIPHEVLSEDGRTVTMGVYGYKVNGDETILAIPSVYAELGKVKKGADPEADPTADPTLPVYAQLEWKIDHFEVDPELIAEQVQEYLDEHPVEIQPATASVLGGIKVGEGLSVTPDGTLSADGGIDAYTKAETDALLATKQPIGDYATSGELDALADIVDGKADAADIPSLDGYATESYVQNYHDNTKQDVITDLASIRSGAALGATALQSVPNTYRTAAQQDIIDNGKQDKLIAGANITIAADGKTISASGGGESYDDTELRERIEDIEAKESTWNDKQDKSLIVSITQSGATYSADKTNAEIYSAWQAGREVIASLNGGSGKIPCTQADATSAYFSLMISGDSVEAGTISIATSGGTQTVTMYMKALQPKTIADSAGYFTTDTVEGALAEIGAELSGINTLIGSGVIT